MKSEERGNNNGKLAMGRGWRGNIIKKHPKHKNKKHSEYHKRTRKMEGNPQTGKKTMPMK